MCTQEFKGCLDDGLVWLVGRKLSGDLCCCPWEAFQHEEHQCIWQSIILPHRGVWLCWCKSVSTPWGWIQGPFLFGKDNFSSYRGSQPILLAGQDGGELTLGSAWSNDCQLLHPSPASGCCRRRPGCLWRWQCSARRRSLCNSLCPCSSLAAQLVPSLHLQRVVL